MSISHLTNTHPGASAHSRAAEQKQRAPQQFTIGDYVSLKVTKRLDERRYLVALASSQHIVESSVHLEVGSRVRAAVVSVGEKLELRYVSAELAEPDPIAPEEDPGMDALVLLESKYSIALHQAERETIRREMENARDSAAMAASGLFLSKLGLPIEVASLRALYSTQVWDLADRANIAAVNANEEGASTEELAQLMGDTLDQSAPTADGSTSPETPGDEGLAASSDQRDESENGRDLARRMLNTQDEGSLSYRYGLLPVMIGDQLVELDLVYFRERREADRVDGIRRLVMTFDTQALGRVEITAKALGDRLSLNMKSDSVLATESLAKRVEEVRDLAIRLGWNVESVVYDFDIDTPRAAAQIVDHVLTAETLSRLL